MHPLRPYQLRALDGLRCHLNPILLSVESHRRVAPGERGARAGLLRLRYRRASLYRRRDHVDSERYRICRTCQVEKPESVFSLPMMRVCKPCTAKTARLWREANPDKARAQYKRYRDANREVCWERTKSWRKRNPEKVARGKTVCNLRANYGITLEDYDRFMKSQDGACAICLRLPDPNSKKDRRLSVDHCHTTGKVRGLLCNRCNRAIGLFGETEDILLAAAAYLRRHANA